VIAEAAGCETEIVVPSRSASRTTLFELALDGNSSPTTRILARCLSTAVLACTDLPRAPKMIQTERIFTRIITETDCKTFPTVVL